MQSHLRSVVLCLISTYMVGFKVLWNFYANCGESVQHLQSVKLIDQSCSRSRAAHMINELKDGLNIAFRLFLWP
jgi:low affinity Fe/Cu permease